MLITHRQPVAGVGKSPGSVQGPCNALVTRWGAPNVRFWPPVGVLAARPNCKESTDALRHPALGRGTAIHHDLPRSARGAPPLREARDRSVHPLRPRDGSPRRECCAAGDHRSRQLPRRWRPDRPDVGPDESGARRRPAAYPAATDGPGVAGDAHRARRAVADRRGEPGRPRRDGPRRGAPRARDRIGGRGGSCRPRAGREHQRGSQGRQAGANAAPAGCASSSTGSQAGLGPRRSSAAAQR